MWADIDPLDSDGRSWGDERKRLEALADELQALETPPTFITDSGSGIQPLWQLADPIEANPEYRQAAESLCAQIEAALGAKGTHNCDRLLRVPGTRNFPNAKKRKLGRGETQARLLYATWRRYSWRQLENLAARLEDEPPEHAEPVQPGIGTGTANTADLDLPSERPKPLEPERLKQLRDRHRVCSTSPATMATKVARTSRLRASPGASVGRQSTPGASSSPYVMIRRHIEGTTSSGP